jgi:hypothetical protein
VKTVEAAMGNQAKDTKVTINKLPAQAAVLLQQAIETMLGQKEKVRNRGKYAMPKIWVQFTGLPEELRDFLVIWAMGSILGITKDVDMPFTRVHEIARMQVAVLDPGLIPEYADVAIGENVYELQFKVEPDENSANPMPMDMDKTEEDDGSGQGGENENKGSKGTHLDGSHKLKTAMDLYDVGNAQDSGGKQNKVYMINTPDLTPDLPDHNDSMERDEVEVVPSGDEHVDYEEQEDYEEHLSTIMNELQEGDPKVQQEILKIIQEDDSLGQKLALETGPAKEQQKSAGLARVSGDSQSSYVFA